MSSKIKEIKAREVLDSRGNPTVEAEVFTEKFSARAIVASGASTGMYEALELRDNEERYGGKGVLKAVSKVNSLSKKIAGMDCREQKEIDGVIINADGTKNKSVLGGNSTTALSMAVCRLGALCSGVSLFKYIGDIFGSKAMTLPIPQFNVINGGAHAGIDNDI